MVMFCSALRECSTEKLTEESLDQSSRSCKVGETCSALRPRKEITWNVYWEFPVPNLTASSLIRMIPSYPRELVQGRLSRHRPGDHREIEMNTSHVKCIEKYTKCDRFVSTSAWSDSAACSFRPSHGRASWQLL